MGTFSRLRYVIAANANALIEKAEDPEKMLRALIREMEDAGEEARLASADLLAEQQHLRRLEAQLTAEMEQWQSRAERAVHEQRDDLARAALKARAEVMNRHEAVRLEQAGVDERVSQLDKDVQTLKSKLADAKLKLKGLHRRNPSNQAGHAAGAAPLSPAEKRMKQAMGRFDRLQTQVENLEARVRSYEVGGPTPTVWDSAAGAADPAIEEELQRMKNRIASAAEPSQSEAAA
jgi:phage shock protein A